MKRVIINGASGFIGSWLVKEMLNNGVQVTVIARHKEKIDSLYGDHVEIYESKYQDFVKLDIPMKEYDAFYQLAWEGVSTEYKDNYDIQMKNIDMSVAAITLAKRLNCKKFIASGTVAEYVFCENIMDFNQKQSPNDLYGAIKTSVHYILEVLARRMDINFIWAVLPSTFGEGRKDSNIISYTITELLKNRKPSYGNLQQLWDFLYVTEVVRALRLVGEMGKTGKIYGIGSGQYLRLKDYICKIRDIINPDLELGIGERPQMSQKTISSCVGIYDLVKDTNFKVEISFEEGIIRTIDYYREKIIEKSNNS